MDLLDGRFLKTKAIQSKPPPLFVGRSNSQIAGTKEEEESGDLMGGGDIIEPGDIIRP